MRTLFTLMMILNLAHYAKAVIWKVGPAQTYTMPSQVAPLVNHGDTVNIDAGIYNSNVCAWTKNNLLLRCVNGMAHLKANGMSHANKAIWVIQGNNVTVERIEFSLAASTSSNGAGIRQEGLNLTVRYCYFHDNENGILAGVLTPCKITVEYCEFNANGFGDGYSHNLYIGHIDTLLFRYNYSHHCKIGHELKSRADVNYILYNRFSNESTGTASREIDLPNGGISIIMGNIIQQGLNGTNSGLIGYGLEGLTNAGSHNLYLINNTLVNQKAAGTFVSVAANTNLYKGYNNIFAGAGTLLTGSPLQLDTMANKKYSSVSAPFVNSNNYDYHLVAGVSAINSATNAGLASNGFSLTPTKEYAHVAGEVNRTVQGMLDIGAYEYVTPAFLFEKSTAVEALVYIDHELLKVQSADPVAEIQVFDISGKLLMSEKHSASIYVSALPKGIYIARVLLENGTGVDKKVIVD